MNSVVFAPCKTLSRLPLPKPRERVDGTSSLNSPVSSKRGGLKARGSWSSMRRAEKGRNG
jgi:hypothetical protein